MRIPKLKDTSYIHRTRNTSWSKANMPTSSKKIALVTGANKGIGFEVARQIGRTGATVLVGARDKSAGEKGVEVLAGEGLTARFIAIDVTDRNSIAAAAATITADFGRLDILVNNAGILDPADGLPSTASLDAVEHVLRTNFLGAVAVTQAMLPLLREAQAARIVNVSSGLGSLTQNGDPGYSYAAVKHIGYSASKAALNMLTVQLAYELRDTAIKVNSADPGYTATGLNGHRGHQTIPEGAAETIRLALLPDEGPSGGYSDSKGAVPW
jgi:NAD(P)-dependent dehydrogenase (short-subunit alcohol dehydrogenase family)